MEPEWRNTTDESERNSVKTLGDYKNELLDIFPDRISEETSLGVPEKTPRQIIE